LVGDFLHKDVEAVYKDLSRRQILGWLDMMAWKSSKLSEQDKTEIEKAKALEAHKRLTR
jgi:hypothetical protein